MDYKYKLDYSFMAKRVKEARDAVHLTQAELAEKIDISTNALAKLETNRMHPKLQTLLNIANVLRLDVNYFLCNSTENTADEEDEVDRLLNIRFHNLSAKDKAFLIHVIDGLKLYQD